MSKLRQERGASVVFALVIFLIVTLFSWTMVNGALTAAQNASMQREEEQAYLSVTSAARLFCQQAAIPIPFEISGSVSDLDSPIPDVDSFPRAFYWDKRSNDNPDEKWYIYRDSNPEIVGGRLTYEEELKIWNVDYSSNHLLPTPKEVSFIHKKAFLKMLEEIEYGGKDEPQIKTLTMTCPKPSDNNDSGASDIEVFNQVNTTVTMNPADYSVRVEFENVKPNDDPIPQIPQNLKYRVVVTLTCMIDEPAPTVSGDQRTYERTLTWKIKSVERGRSTS